MDVDPWIDRDIASHDGAIAHDTSIGDGRARRQFTKPNTAKYSSDVFHRLFEGASAPAV
jgi:hypothetical protein